MKFTTIGRNFYPGREVFLFFADNEDLKTQVNTGDRFKLIIVDEGNGMILINGIREMVVAPCLICLNEKDEFQLSQFDHLSARALYFHPCVLNSVLDFENIRNDEALTLTEIQDCAILRPFLVKEEPFNGLIPMGIAGKKTIDLLVERIQYELTEQNHDFWPCQTRAHFYQLLIEVEILKKKPPYIFEPVRLQSNDADDILLYLHRNYFKKVTIQDITDDLHVNRNTLRERFVKVTGYSIITYLNRLRVQMAASLLKDTDLLVREISDKVGFSDTTNFGRMFQRYMGCSPTVYRNQK